MTVLEGSVAVRGRLAYVAQQAWILNATLRDNILFGQEYHKERWDSWMTDVDILELLAWSRGMVTPLDEGRLTGFSVCLCRYQSVLSACCLRPDLALLPDADLTEVTLPVSTLV